MAEYFNVAKRPIFYKFRDDIAVVSQQLEFKFFQFFEFF